MHARQRIRYVTTLDGTRLAWAETGSGYPMVKAANWLSHLEYEWGNPLWQHWLQFFSTHFRLIRYDERGCGMSEWSDKPLTVQDWCSDLELVIEAARPAGPVNLLGISQGAAACLKYAIQHPDRVARMVLYGGYVHGALRRGDPDERKAYWAMIDLAEVGWSSSNSTFRQLFTSRFIPEGTPEQLHWFNELCARSTGGKVAAALLGSRAVVDCAELLPQVRTPTLVLHARNDAVVPVSEGRILASGIAGAEFVELDSCNHVLLSHEPAWERFCEAVLAFLRPEGVRAENSFAALSAREQEVLSLIVAGLGNARIAEVLGIGEKTVRNHASNLFDKLGVRSRAQAIVFAHTHGFKTTKI